MIINNLELTFDKQEEGRLVFKTDSGAEISIEEYLLKDFDKNKKVYIALDEQPLVSSQENKKEILNEVLNEE